MRSKLIIEGNAVYEIDEDCMLRKSRKNALEKGREGKRSRKEPLEEQVEEGR